MLWGRINERTTMDLGLYPWRTIRHPGRGVLTPFRLSFGDLGVGPQNLWWSARFMFTNSKYLIFYLHKILYRLVRKDDHEFTKHFGGFRQSD